MPAPAEAAAEFMSKSATIALAGADRENLGKAKWAEIPRQDYVDASHCLTAHGMAYDGMTVNDEHARALFAPHGQTSEAVAQQAIPVTTDGPLPHRMDGPQAQAAQALRARLNSTRMTYMSKQLPSTA